MTLQECYKAIDGSYEEVLRLMRSERLVQKFVLRFLEDKSYEMLCQALSEKDRAEAFRAAHTLKGVCQNLAFTRLQKSASTLTEALRDAWAPDTLQLAEQVHADYKDTVAAIERYKLDLLP
jgi:HPt (histidine-containing phosphotransfer) domain-containing protein